MKDEDILLWMKNYCFSDLLKWIECTSIHPNNDIYQIRFEKLLACLLTIDKKEFSNNILTKDEFYKAINNFFTTTNNEYVMVEDFQPFDQTKLIPYFYNGEEKFFFYGLLERSYEFVEKFDYLYLKSNIDCYGNNTLQNFFESSINFQTELLKCIISLEESKVKTDTVYVPSEEFCEIIWQKFKVVEDVSNYATKIEEKFNNGSLNYDVMSFAYHFKSIYIIDNAENTFFIMPQIHIEVLYNIAEKFITKNNRFDGLNLLRENMKKSLMVISNPFNIVEKIYDQNRNIISKENMICCRFNEDILLIFYLFDKNGVESINLDKEISISFTNILNSEFITYKYMAQEELSSIMPINQINIIPIVVFNTYSISANISVESQDIDFLHFEYLDFKRMAELFSSMEDLYKYLREVKDFENTAQLMMMDQIDKLAFYIENGNRFFEIGKIPEYIYFEPHQWHDFYLKRLYEKYQHDIYRYLEKMNPYYYDYVKEIRKNVYECYNRMNFGGGIMAKIHTGYTFIRYPVSVALIRNDLAVKFTEEVLKTLFAEYIPKIVPRISDMVKRYNFSFGEIYYIEMVPYEIISEELGMEFLEEYINELSEERPIVIKTLLNKKNNIVHSFVIFKAENLINIFDSAENVGERYCVSEIIKSIFSYCFPINEKLIELVNETTNLLCPVSKRRYGITSVEILNRRSQSYKEYQKINETDLSVVNRKIAHYLHELSILPGTYEGQDNIELDKLILVYLSEMMSNELSKYNSNIIEFAYLQIEYAEFQRDITLKQRKYDLGTDNDFNVIEKISEEANVMSQHTLAIKHIIAAVLKYKPSGYKSITKEGWSQLLAIAFVINNSSSILELAKYKLQSHKVTLTDLYELKDNFGEMKFDNELYTDKIAYYKIMPKMKRINQINLRERIKLNEVYFNEFGFYIFDMFDILYFLGTSDLEDSKSYPLNKFDMSHIIRTILEKFKEFNEDYVEKIILYLSLNKETYNNFDVIAISNLMRYKERINLCPFICINDEIIFGNQMCLHAFNLWTSYFSNGDSPYQKDIPKTILTEVKAIHREKDLQLEQIAKEIGDKALGERYVEANISNFKRLSKKFPNRADCGEIDLLAVNLEKKIVFVIDAKNINKRVRAYDMSKEIEDFFEGSSSYNNKLNKKYEFICSNIEAVLEHFDVKYSKEWIIKKAFCVDNVYPAAFIKDDVEFILVEELEGYLNGYYNINKVKNVNFLE